jgi:ribosome-associated protein
VSGGAGDGDLDVGQGVRIPRWELSYQATQSGGPGGQHANRSATRVQLFWDVDSSSALDERQKARVRSRLRNRLDKHGVLQLAEGGSRSQHRNREAVTERFVELVAAALRPRKKRKPTRPTRASKERRLQAKKRRGEVKETRKKIRPPE